MTNPSERSPNQAPKLEVSLSDIQNPKADKLTDYPKWLKSSCEILNLAIKKDAINAEQRNVFVHDFRAALNAGEVMQVQHELTGLLYREAIDYSDILLHNGIIDRANHAMLKENISKGKDFTNRDLDEAERINSIGARAAAGLEDPERASKEILGGLDRMKTRRKIYPNKNRGGNDQE